MSIERKYRVLGIVPYENLKSAMIIEAAKCEDIEMVIYTGSLEDGAQLALQHTSEGFDILISRGGIAGLIRKIASIPVTEITLSTNDILRAILPVENLTEAYAVVGYPTVTQPAHVLCEMMNYRASIVTIYGPDGLDPISKELKAGGYNFTLCDMITEAMVREVGMEPILILSGPESTDIAVDYSINMCRVLTETRARDRLFTRALDMQGTKAAIMEQDGSILFSTCNKKNTPSVTGYLEKLAESPHSVSAKTFHTIGNGLYSISVEETTFLEESCYIFCLEQDPLSAGRGRHGIRLFTYTKVSAIYPNSLYFLTPNTRPMEGKIHMINQTTLPAMTLGERGSGKNQLAAKLYLESSMQRYPYITIDCQVLSERTWNYIIDNCNSPLNDKSNTILINNPQVLSRHRQEQLLSFLMGINAHKRNRIILSCSQALDRDLSDPFKNFIDYLPCTAVYMPLLWELTGDIQGSSSLYLNVMNVGMSRQIVGFIPEALVLLISYRWLDNFTQSKWVLAELVTLTSVAYTQRDTMFEVIEKEKRQHVLTTADLFDYDRSFGEMTREIVKVTLSQYGGNQTPATKRFGIGWTTLWRYLNGTD